MALTKISGSILKDPLNLGEVSIGGTLTYQDVTNVDSVGIITARSTIDAQGDVSIADKIIHTGDENTSIRFPSADTIRLETGGVARLTVDSSGNTLTSGGLYAQGDLYAADSIIHTGDTDTKIAFTNNQIDLQCAGSSRAYINNYALYIQSGFPLAFLASSGATPNIKSGGTNNQDLLFTTGSGNPTRMQIKSDGKIGIGTDNPSQTLTVRGTILKTRSDSGLGLIYLQQDGSYNGQIAINQNGGVTKTLLHSAGDSYFNGGNVGIGLTNPSSKFEVKDGLLTVTTTGQANGIRLVDSSTSSGSPNLEIISKRQDANNNTAFSSNIFLGKNRTDAKVSAGIILGTINFGGNHTDGSESNISYSAGIRGIALGDFNSKSDMPTDLVFTTGTSGTDRDGEAAGQSNVGTERLRIDSRGAVTKPNNPAFFARPPGNYNLSGDTIVGGTWSTSDSEAFVRGTLANGSSIWNNNTGIFTVPVTGIYYFHWNVFLKNNTTRRDAMIYNGSTIIARTEIGSPNSSANNKSVAVSAVVSLTAGNEIKFGCLTAGSANKIYQSNRPWSYACGYLIG